MAKEIERKFLVHGEPWSKQKLQGLELKQGYLSTDPNRTVRVRTTCERAYITIKANVKEKSFTRLEYEYEIPLDEAKLILTTLVNKPLIEKIRYHIPYAGMIWDVDVFLGENAGLVLAEIELTSETQEFAKPNWVGAEVTADNRYFNSYLVEKPFSTWNEA